MNHITLAQADEQFDQFDAYLIKDGEIIGIHGVGEANRPYTVSHMDETQTHHVGFCAIESWGNEYNWDFKMIGRGSFRIGHLMEDDVTMVLDNGWVQFSPLVRIK